MKISIMFIFVAVISGCSTSLIGKQVPPYPDGLASQSGACISDALGEERFCDFAIGILERVGEKPYALMVQKQIGRSGKSAVWLVTDQIDWPYISEETYLAFGICRKNGETDQTIATIVKIADEEWLKATSWAQKVNLNTGKFETISSEGIECVNESWGL